MSTNIVLQTETETTYWISWRFVRIAYRAKWQCKDKKTLLQSISSPEQILFMYNRSSYFIYLFITFLPFYKMLSNKISKEYAKISLSNGGRIVEIRVSRMGG